jgi:hypothetical protein
VPTKTANKNREYKTGLGGEKIAVLTTAFIDAAAFLNAVMRYENRY